MRHLLVIAIVGLLGARALGEGTVALRSASTVPAGSRVTLADVAVLEGNAAAYGGVVVADAPSGNGAVRVTIDDVKRRLRETPGTNMGRLLLCGGECQVRGATSPASTPEVTPVKASRPSPGVRTVRTLVQARLAEMLGVARDDLRLSWDEAQADLLDTPVDGRTVNIQPTGAGDRVPVAVRVYQGDTILASGSTRVGVEVRRTVMVARRTLQRADTISDEGISIETRWVPASMVPASPEGGVGSVARARVEVGAIIEQRQVEAPVVVRRGDLVSVDCVCGTVVVRTNARALENGRDGEVVTLQSLTSKKTYQARMNGAGKAVLVAPDSLPTPGDRESKP